MKFNMGDEAVKAQKKLLSKILGNPLGTLFVPVKN